MAPRGFRVANVNGLDYHDFMTKASSTILPESSYRKILIIKPGALGDLLQMTPVIRTLTQAFPSSEITLLVGNEPSKDIFRNNPNVSQVFIFDKKGAHRSIRSMVTLWKRIRVERFDLVLNFQRSNIKAWMLASAAFPCRLLVYQKARRRRVHAVQNYLDTIVPLGIRTSDLHLDFFPDDAARQEIDALLPNINKETLLVALNPGASHPVNRWPVKHFAELCDSLSEKHNAKVILVGGGADVVLAQEIINLSVSKPLSFAGQTSVAQLGALLQRCEVLVSGDTGPLHLASAVGTPAIALFGAADPERTGPVGQEHRVIQAKEVGCVPCRSRTCSNKHYLECMETISAQQVIESVLSLLHRQGNPYVTTSNTVDIG